MTERGWIILVALGAALPVSAQWQLIDNFQQWEADDLFYEATDIGWYASSQDQVDEYWMLQDPVDPENIALYVASGDDGALFATTWVMKNLPNGGIDPGETGTIFFRFRWDVLSTTSWHMATADKPLAFDNETGLQTAPGAWDDLNALIRLNTDAALEHYDDNSYVTTNPQVFPSREVWYNFWMVVENTWDMSTISPTCTGTCRLYIQGEGIGDGVSPTLIPVGTDTAKDSAAFRRPPADDEGNPQAIIWVVYATRKLPDGSPSLSDVFYLDDFYFSQGENITNPLEGWADYTIEPAGDVDTGDWLGWLNVSKAPYLWSYALDGWLYMEEPVADAPGTWAYFYK